jgi:hypothetical protein
MYPKYNRHSKHDIRSQPNRYDPPEKRADLPRKSSTYAKVDPGSFWVDHFAISQSRPKEVNSLSEDGGPTSMHWQNGSATKVLILNFDRRGGAETVLDHIERFQQDGLSFPKEIYLDTREKTPSQRALKDFENKLAEGINELNDEKYVIKRTEMDDGYIKLNLVTRQAEESISGNVRKTASSQVKSNSDSKGKDTSQSGKKRLLQDRDDSELPQKIIALDTTKDATVSTRTINYNGKSHALTLVSDIGGYHLIYSPTGPNRLVNQRPNDKILVRVPRNNEAPRPEVGFKYGLQWSNEYGIKIPYIHNRNTLATDGFYIVDKIPNKFDPENSRHFDQVKQVLTNMSVQGYGPDFRPDNVRFNDKDELVLVDFSENPAVQNAKGDDFPSLMKEFTEQFAALGGKYRDQVYEDLRADMSPYFRKQMDNARYSWQK